MNDKLIERYLDGTASGAERREVEAWFGAQGEALPEIYNNDEARSEAARERTLALLQERIKGNPQRQMPLRRRLYRYAVAASVLLCCGTGIYFYARQHQKQAAAILAKGDITPGHNQATLTLANGKKIILTKGLSGRLAVQNQTIISASQTTISYDAHSNGDQFSYNTLSTARGEQSPLPLVLADGTKVWLNAESSITFPTAFTGKERIVKVTGEAYFEVKHNDKQPFKALTATQTIEDIGTQFDVKAYDDEPATTTLLEGSVKVNSLLLKPGQQAVNGQMQTVNVERYIAWKNGDFDFEGDDIQTIMRELSRWYNIDVNYEGTGSKIVFYAKISRSQNISVVLSALQRTQGVKFKIDGRRVTIIQ